jgi:hypothetical protein
MFARGASGRAVAAAIAAGVALGAAAVAAAAPPAPVAAARLQGSFLLAGRVTDAVDVRSERVGQLVRRTWTFTSGCVAGACTAVDLARARATGTDVLTLRRTGPGAYAGNGSFDSPLLCAGKLYPQGQKVPFTITVQVTRASQVGSVAVATRIDASYRSRRRINRTPCVVAPSHDAARYHGRLAAVS